MQCGLLGRHLSHSYSPQIHGMLGDYGYSLFEKEPEALEAFLADDSYQGLNVTIPYKKAVIPFCDALSERAKKLGAVNTLVRRDGKLIGHNTDYFGFQSMVEKCGVPVLGKKALVLGSGGASVTAVAVLEELGANVTVISRSGPNNYENLNRHADAAVIVNATPVGMFPKVDDSPVDLSLFPNLECVLDLIYNPANTRLMQAAQARNIPCQNGLWMLVAQAKESAEWFMDRLLPDHVIEQIYAKVRMQMENIVLIGMPGCGKSTVGKLLAERLNKHFIDTDTQIVNRAGIPIPEIFETQGEEGFRRIETEVIAELCKGAGAVIATGGGCVTRPENYAHLHQNSRIIWVNRNICDLPTDGRPLSQTGKLKSMFQIRKPMYERFSDYSVDNFGTPEDTVDAIVDYMQKEI